MDKICYRLDAVELWQKGQEEHQNRVKKEQIKNTQDFIKDMKVARSGVIKALTGEATNMDEIVNDQIMFDQRTVDKLTSMVERIQNEVQEKANKPTRDSDIPDNYEGIVFCCPECNHTQTSVWPCKKCGYDHYAQQKNIKEKKGIEESDK